MRIGLLLAAISLTWTCSAQNTTVRSVSSLPAACSPGGGSGGSAADHVDLWNGATNVPYYCQTANSWTSFSAGGGSFTAGGDLSGSGSSQQVIGIRNTSVPTLATGYLRFTGSAFQWTTAGTFTSLTDSTDAASDKIPVPNSSGVFAYFTAAQGAVKYNTVANGGPSFAQAAASDLSNGVSGTGAVVLQASPTINGTLTVNSGSGGSMTGLKTFQLQSNIFSGIGSCAGGNTFAEAGVTDSTVTTVGATITGGGSHAVKAICNGTNWIVEADLT